MKPANRMADIPPSGIRRYFELAEEMEDVISLGVGEPDFAAPWVVREAAIDSLERGRTSYTTNRGLAALREEIERYVSRAFDLQYSADQEIIVTTGASEAVDIAIRALVDPGDIVAIPEPTYLSYRPLATLSGAEILPVPTDKSDAFRLTEQALVTASVHRADYLVICYPNNPTGAILTEPELRAVASFAKEHDINIISDEIYAELTYGQNHTSIATLPGMRSRTVVVNGFSKAFAMTGLRLGYAMGPPTIIDAMNRIHQYGMLSAPTTAQYAALEGLRGAWDAVDEMRSQYNRRRNYVLSRFDEMDIACFEAEGAFYVFPECPGENAETFAEDLLTEERVAVVPGDVFGSAGQGHLRVSYATSLENLRIAMDRIERFVA